MSRVSELTAELAKYDAVIEALTDERDSFASKLEIAAVRFYVASRKASPRALDDAKSCTACSFEYSKVELDPFAVIFKSTCSWCDYAGGGLKIGGAVLERYLPE